jgi:hypothetical protein
MGGTSPERRGEAPPVGAMPHNQATKASREYGVRSLGWACRHIASAVLSQSLQLISIGREQIVPHCEKLLERLHKVEDVLPKYQEITGQLYDILRVTSMDQIVPSVRKLASASHA